ncbi:MAG: hypothetical protein A2X82_08985 [Geobacteraceae bacterium GWC2_55_20]|nr:MAG: hypothetical protein A2X82_08985 [Geobacteraceae bacterium GWC2_55_20]
MNYFALRPLSTKLISTTETQIQIYESGKGLTLSEAQSFSFIDIEVWARQFLQAVDDFLLQFLPAGAANLETKRGIALPDAPLDAVERVLLAKVMLAETIVDGIDYLFQVPADSQELARVREGLAQLLLVGLSAGYGTDTLFETSAVLAYVHGRPVPCMGGLPSAMGRKDIPVPLRFFPALPVLMAQSGNPATLSPLDLPQARQWNFEFTFESQSVDQDAIYVAIRFDQAGTLIPKRLAAPHSSLFDNLAQFVQVYPAIRSNMAKSLNPDDPDYQAVEPAINAFAGIAERVAMSWAGHRREANVGTCAVDHATTDFIYRLERKFSGESGSVRLDCITLNLVEKAMRPTVNWPSLCVLTSDGQYYKLIGEPVGDDECLYTYNAALSWSDGSTIRFGLENLDVFQAPMVWTGISVRRNENLSYDPPVKQEFVYHTPTQTFAAPCTPSIRQPALIDIGRQITDLKGTLSQFFAVLLETAETPPSVKLSIEYHYELEYDSCSAPESARVEIALPVLLLLPPVAYEKNLGANVAAEIQKWWKENTPGKPGYFEMSVGVIASSNIPLLTLSQVTFSIAECGVPLPRKAE